MQDSAKPPSLSAHNTAPSKTTSSKAAPSNTTPSNTTPSNTTRSNIAPSRTTAHSSAGLSPAQSSAYASTAQAPEAQLTETLFYDGASYYRDIIQGLSQAQHHIAMEAYIYDSEGIGEAISAALIDAAARGVEVQLLVDGVGVAYHFDQLAQQLNDHGVQVRIFHPLPWRLKHWRFAATHKQGLSKLLHLLSYINQRNHRKMLLIDRQTIWLGSINVSQSHLSADPALTTSTSQPWRDTAIRITGVDTGLPEAAFNLAWHRSRAKQHRRIAHKFIQPPFILNFSRYLRRKKRRQLLDKLAQARRRIWVTNAYFVPERALILALKSASKKGVDVRILLPAKSDISFMPLISAYFYQDLLSYGVQVYEYQPNMLHSKTLLIDDWACVGSSNLNGRSLINDLEIDYPLQTKTAVKDMARQFNIDLEQAVQRSPNITRLPRWRRWLGGLLLLALGRWL